VEREVEDGERENQVGGRVVDETKRKKWRLTTWAGLRVLTRQDETGQQMGPACGKPPEMEGGSEERREIGKVTAGEQPISSSCPFTARLLTSLKGPENTIKAAERDGDTCAVQEDC
jgi:hypothetical protein